MQVDPLSYAAGDETLYRYAGDSPLTREDCFGLDWDPHTVQAIISSTDTGRAMTDYYRKHIYTIQIYWSKEIQTYQTNDAGQRREEDTIYGVHWEEKFGHIIILDKTLNADDITAAASWIHEMEHAAGGDEFNARMAEAHFYLELLSLRGQQIIDKIPAGYRRALRKDYHNQYYIDPDVIREMSRRRKGDEGWKTTYRYTEHDTFWYNYIGR
jgi:hypothetical protein